MVCEPNLLADICRFIGAGVLAVAIVGGSAGVVIGIIIAHVRAKEKLSIENEIEWAERRLADAKERLDRINGRE